MPVKEASRLLHCQPVIFLNLKIYTDKRSIPCQPVILMSLTLLWNYC